MCLLAVLLLQCRISPVSIRGMHFHFGVSVENHYGCFFFGRPYARRICSIFPLCMESKAILKSTNNIVGCRIFARTPSRILRIVNICEVVDLFLRKPFWFFLRMLSILGLCGYVVGHGIFWLLCM